MQRSDKCPCCGITWQSDKTIYEHFLDVYTKEGVPSYARDKGLYTPEAAALETAENYGCTPETPKHFGINMMGMEDGTYDGVSWWGCTACGMRQNRFTDETQKDHEEKEFLINYGIQNKR